MRVRPLLEQKDALVDTANEIHSTAEKEGRQLSETETERLTAIRNEIGEEAKDGKPATGLEAQIEQAQWLENQIKAKAGAKKQTVIPGPSMGPVDGKETKTFARPKRYGNIRGFAGGADQAFAAGSWIAAQFGNHEKSREWCQNNGIMNAMTESDNNKGGYLVPTEMSQAIIDLREEYGVARQELNFRAMASDQTTIQRRKSGLTAYALGEAATITASDAEWNQVEVVPKKWGALSRYSSELSEDAVIDLASTLAGEMAYAFAQKEDQTLFLGDGTSTYHGITGIKTALALAAHDGSEYEAASGNTAFSTLDLTDFENMVGMLPRFPGIMPKWHISQAGFWASMARLAYAAGGNTKDDLQGGTGLQFLGFPVVINNVTNSTTAAQTSTAGLCYFGDLNMAVTAGERRGFRFDTSRDVYFTSDEIAVRGTNRWGMNFHERGDTTTAGPVVMLTTPSS